MKKWGDWGDYINLARICETGFWYCERCEKVVHLALDLDNPAICPRCRKRTATWQPPAFARNDLTDTLKQA